MEVAEGRFLSLLMELGKQFAPAFSFCAKLSYAEHVPGLSVLETDIHQSYLTLGLTEDFLQIQIYQFWFAAYLNVSYLVDMDEKPIRLLLWVNDPTFRPLSFQKLLEFTPLLLKI